jgi:hypothetical protein
VPVLVLGCGIMPGMVMYWVGVFVVWALKKETEVRRRLKARP